jgi:predicted nucleic acid-binding protein
VKPVLLDTGAIIAALDRSETYHKKTLELMEGLAAPLVTCEAVIAEACYLLRHLPQLRDLILENVAVGTFQVPFRLHDSVAGVLPILVKYRDRPVDYADACLIQMANEFQTGDILTLDRDFRVYRWGRNTPFRLLVPLD